MKLLDILCPKTARVEAMILDPETEKADALFVDVEVAGPMSIGCWLVRDEKTGHLRAPVESDGEVLSMESRTWVKAIVSKVYRRGRK